MGTPHGSDDGGEIDGAVRAAVVELAVSASRRGIPARLTALTTGEPLHASVLCWGGRSSALSEASALASLAVIG
jgi:hypothetical protein